MVFKPTVNSKYTPPLFENDVKEYGIQTYTFRVTDTQMFENDVKEYGIQTTTSVLPSNSLFENDVKEYGIQTQRRW